MSNVIVKIKKEWSIITKQTLKMLKAIIDYQSLMKNRQKLTMS